MKPRHHRSQSAIRIKLKKDSLDSIAEEDSLFLQNTAHQERKEPRFRPQSSSFIRPIRTKSPFSFHQDRMPSPVAFKCSEKLKAIEVEAAKFLTDINAHMATQGITPKPPFRRTPTTKSIKMRPKSPDPQKIADILNLKDDCFLAIQLRDGQTMSAFVKLDGKKLPGICTVSCNNELTIQVFYRSDYFLENRPDFSTVATEFIVDRRGPCGGFYFSITASKPSSGYLTFKFSKPQKPVIDVFERFCLQHPDQDRINKAKLSWKVRPVSPASSSQIESRIHSAQKKKQESLASRKAGIEALSQGKLLRKQEVLFSHAEGRESSKRCARLSL